MNIEIDQQRKFIDEFSKIAANAPQKFKERWDGTINFVNPSHSKFIPSLNNNSIEFLSVELRNKFEILRNKYYSKSL